MNNTFSHDSSTWAIRTDIFLPCLFHIINLLLFHSRLRRVSVAGYSCDAGSRLRRAVWWLSVDGVNTLPPLSVTHCSRNGTRLKYSTRHYYSAQTTFHWSWISYLDYLLSTRTSILTMTAKWYVSNKHRSKQKCFIFYLTLFQLWDTVVTSQLGPLASIVMRLTR